MSGPPFITLFVFMVSVRCIVAGLTSSVPGGCHTKHKSREGAIQAWSTALSVGLVEMVN